MPRSSSTTERRLLSPAPSTLRPTAMAAAAAAATAPGSACPGSGPARTLMVAACLSVSFCLPSTGRCSAGAGPGLPSRLPGGGG